MTTANLQNMSCCISIDAKFDADFKNVYFLILILRSLRFMSQKLPILHVFWHGSWNRQFFAYKSRTSQNMKKKVYIFEISIKFCVDWYATWHFLKNFNFCYFYWHIVCKKNEKQPGKGSTRGLLELTFINNFLISFNVLKKKVLSSPL